ncbi:UPF0648 protein C3H5.09c [Termitomyces sp. T112]|nr:UPF0648 protein C3H5.09c [Termitomyces sp. T112]
MSYTPVSFLRAFLLENPTNLWWISIIIWIIRIATVSLFFRSYLFPLILNTISKHVHIRSVSFFSIRGLYIRAGPRTIRVDRVRYSFSFAKGINVRLDGVNVEVGRSKAKPLPRLTRHNRRLTLADFAPSPMAHRLWNLASSAYAVVEPHLRPLIRTCVVAVLRLLIRWLPHIISGLYFEAHSTTATFPDLLGASVSAGILTLHVNLSFTDLENVIDRANHSKPRPARSRRSYGMAAWRKRFAASFQRTLDRAWGNTQGNASIAVRLHHIAGSALPEASRTVKTAQFLHLPSAIDFDGSLRFNPREGTADNHSLEVSLNIGDCSVELDTLKLLLQSLGPNESEVVHEFDLGESISPLQSSTLFSSSPITSPSTETESVFSLLSPTLSLKPGSASSAGLSPAPASLPSSPFLEKLSASIRPRRRILYKPCTRLKNYKKTSLLSVLNHATIQISSVTLATQNKWGLDPYQLEVHNIVLSSSISNSPSEDTFRRNWLGNHKKIENCDPDTYAFKFSTTQVAVERRTKLDSMRLLTLETMKLQAIITQWPAPWVAPSPFMAGDPNAPFLAIRAKVGGLDVTERLERLRELIAHIEPSTRATTSSRTPPDSFKMPRIAVDAECGILRGRIICADTKGAEPFAVEVRNNGFVFSMESSFVDDYKSTARHSDHSRVPFRNYFKFSLILEPTLMRVRSRARLDTCKFTSLRSYSMDFLEDPSILSIESFEVFGDGHAIAFMDYDEDFLASVLAHSPILELHISTDAVCVEVWNPHVVAALQQLSSIVPPQEDSHSMPTAKRPLLDRMLPGISTTLAIPRFAVILTSPDINPRDNLDLSRGVAFRTSLLISYCSMHANHIHRFHGLNEQTKRREKLRLPQQHLIDAVSAARTSVITEKASAHIKISFSGLSFRSAVSTQYDADNPFLFERDDPALEKQEFLNIPSITVNLCLFGKRGAVPSKAGDTCDLSMVVPNVKATFHLAYIYSLMLALQCIKGIFTKSFSDHAVKVKPPSELRTKIKIKIATVQIQYELRTRQLVARIDDVEIHALPERSLSMQLGKLVVWVCLHRRIMKWEEQHGTKWEELVCIQTLQGSLASSHVTPSISLDGESARLRIPHDYIFADLVTDAVVTVKAIRHLNYITAQHKYTSMPTPEPEGPKHVPRIIVHFRWLCLEAADDPFESKLSVIWRCGYDAAKQRIDREEAYKAKVAAIYRAESQVPPSGSAERGVDYHFGGEHSVSIGEARRRLDAVHELDWTLRLRDLCQIHSRSDKAMNQLLRGKHTNKDSGLKVPDIVQVSPIPPAPPLFRALFHEVFLDVHRPSFPAESLSDFLYEQGSGLPRDTEFSLLIPLHLNFTLTSLHITLRDYPLPLFSIPATKDHTTPAWAFETDLVIAEEMGSELSVDWIDCVILDSNHGARGASAFSISVPKTIMPVKTYANPVIHVNTTSTTVLSWSISYAPAIQDLMKVIENLTTAPRDSSPGIGFWDKMRLIFHWTFVITFKGEVRFHLKGSRDPYKLDNEGAGFVLAWLGNTKLLIARENKDRELMQVISDSMFIAIPNLEHLYPQNQLPSFASRTPEASKPFRKIIAKVRSGVRFGVGFVLERACGGECYTCSGSAFHRKCRYFEFLPHYKVRLEKKVVVPKMKSSRDSYNGFRSDFIHLSISLTSSTRPAALGSNQEPSSIHLTPKAFAHFWAWCSLFDSALSLPTRQGSYYPPRPISPKFGRHLATLKYRLHIRNLFIMHAYIDESRETWVDGVTPWIGVKGIIEEIHADMHQRDEETPVPSLIPNTTKVLRRKPVYAAEVSLKGMDLRALLAIFKEPLRQEIGMIAPPQRSNYRAHKNLPTIPSASVWFDTCDFVETDWSSSAEPRLHLLPLVTCPQFTYFKRNSVLPHNSTLSSKFGSEGSHSCLLGKSLSVTHVQIGIAEARIRELCKLIKNKKLGSIDDDSAILEKKVSLLKDYVLHLRGVDSGSSKHQETTNAVNLSYSISPDEWAEFEHVYHFHCPKVSLDSVVRDVILQYYYCSRARKGLEYHMATRAVKFIRDQAEAALDDDSDTEESQERSWEGVDAAQMAASALRKIFKGDSGKPSVEISTNQDKATRPTEKFNALDGWSEGVSPRKSHFCLLLKPQILMRGENPKDSIIVTAIQARLQVFAIMDNNNVDDPVSGKVMSRSRTSLSSLQTFAPTSLVTKDSFYVPFEVLIDLRCETSAFDQLVPQTDAIFHYDKFNRLRLRNNVTSVTRAPCGSSSSARDRHLQDETDLIRVHIPRFTVSASDEHFQAISYVITQLLLFSDAAHKTRLEKLETLLFTYDFTDLASAASVVANLQVRLGEAHEARKAAEYNHSRKLEAKEGQLELLKLKAHIFLLSEELNFLFDAIKLAQDRHGDHSDQKSALLLHASSDEISWKMLDDRLGLFAKLVVQSINFNWLSRRDSSTSNDLSVRDLTAFDGSKYAIWPEIVSKYDEPANHPLLKRGLFLIASWTVLAPVGGIIIYESFEMSLHPIQLQIDARVGRRIMEYMWPARKRRHAGHEEDQLTLDKRMSIDSPRALHGPKPPHELTKGQLVPPLRKLGASRSFSDLRESSKENSTVPTLRKMPSSGSLRKMLLLGDGEGNKRSDAIEMKTRTSQRSFVLVKISSMNLLLSIVKEGSFECHEARIKTRDLEYRNQTWSFEELVNQFIPSNTSWRGWVKMAFHQPLLPVFPVARELISKTKLLSYSSKTITPSDVKGPPPKLGRARALSGDDDLKRERSQPRGKSKSPSRGRRIASSRNSKLIPPIASLPFSDEPESFVQGSSAIEVEKPSRSDTGRKRMMSFFNKRGATKGSSGSLDDPSIA